MDLKVSLVLASISLPNSSSTLALSCALLKFAISIEYRSVLLSSELIVGLNTSFTTSRESRRSL